MTGAPLSTEYSPGIRVVQALPGARALIEQTVGGPWIVKGETSSLPDKGHDALAMGTRTVAVVDGATPLEASWPQDLDEFARLVARCIVQRGDRAFGATSEVWDSVLAHVRETFPGSGVSRTAAAAFAVFEADVVHMSVLGDVDIRYRVGDEWHELHDDRLALAEQQLVLPPGTSLEAARIALRRTANSHDGYPILGTDLVDAYAPLSVTVGAEDLRTVVLLSDGAREVESGRRDVDDATRVEISRREIMPRRRRDLAGVGS